VATISAVDDSPGVPAAGPPAAASAAGLPPASPTAGLPPASPTAGLPPALVLAGVLLGGLGICALLGRIGSDAGWLSALGGIIARRHAVPAGLPFAPTGATGHWPNPLVLAELIFAGLHGALGDRGLMLAQLLAVAGGLAILVSDARRGGAEPVGIAAAIGLVFLGAATALAIARVQMFSLVLFPALVALLRAERRAPSSRIWLAVGLLVLWANLHGADLLGAAALGAHLLLDRGRRRPGQSLLIGLAAVAALWLTPALGHTGSYDLGLLTNAAARTGQGMWGPLSLHNPLDLLLAAAVVVLGIKAVGSDLPAWEAALALGLAVLTIRAQRNGVWLVFLLAPPAARGLAPVRSLGGLALPLGALGSVLLAFALVRGPVATAGAGLVPRSVALAHGGPVLADGSLDEAVAEAGGRIWAGDPIDAFPHRVQLAYLAWLNGQRSGAAPATRGAQIVLVTRGTPDARLMASLPGFEVAVSSRSALIYRRVAAARP
jgi:hypothetical protein